MRKRFTKSPKASLRSVRANRNIGRKRPIRAAESYGWVVNDWEGWEAYNFAIDSGAFTEKELNAEIVRGLSSEEMARALAFIFRNYEFRKWEERDNDEYDDDEYDDDEYDDDEYDDDEYDDDEYDDDEYDDDEE